MMRPLSIVGIALLWTAACCWAALAQQAEGQPTFRAQFRRQLQELLPGMGAENIPDRRDSQQKFQEVCFQLGAPGREADRAEACEVIAQALGTDLATPARIWLLKQLEYLGRAESVDAVAASLDDADPHVRDAARRALQNNPAPEANAKLLAKLPASSGTWRVGLINSLGARGDHASVGALVKLLGDEDQAAVAPAANALGKIGGPEATEALAAALPGASGELIASIADALLRCADKLLAQRNTDQAGDIYKQLYNPQMPRPIRLAALQGMLNAAGSNATRMILELLAGDDKDEQAIAAGQVENVLGSGALRASEKAFSELPTSGKVLLLAALAVQSDKSAMPVAVKAAESDNPDLRLAGIRALANLGDVSVVPMLIDFISGGGQVAGPAKDSLQQLVGDGVDEAIVDALTEAKVPVRGTLIEVIHARKAMVAVPALLKEAEHQDSGIRSRAVRALGDLARGEHVPEMIKLLLKSEKGRQRDEIEKAIMFVCNRIPEEDRRADPVLAALSRADLDQCCVLLPLLGRIGGNKALEAIQSAIKGDVSRGKEEIQEAGIRALCNWPDATVADELLKIAESSDNKSHRISTLRAYIRVITLPSQRPAKKTLGLLKKAMELAAGDDERRLILSRASSVRDIETLRFVVPYLDQESLAAQASRAVVELAHHRELREPNKAEFDKALKKVIRICEDRKLVDRARQYMEGL